MSTLLERIEWDAAKRLVLPPGRLPAQELPRYQRFRKVEYQWLKRLHRAGAGGREICQARAAVLDVLLRHLLETVLASCPPGAARLLPAVTLVALGGYGRRELNPHSDLDLMFLHDGSLVSGDQPHSLWRALSRHLLYTLYDTGLTVGYSIRTPAECVEAAQSDLRTKTSLIEARWLAGDASLFQAMTATVLHHCVEGFEADYIAARLEDQAVRRAKFGNSACLLEPNIKNGCGGLRDYQNLLWMA